MVLGLDIAARQTAYPGMHAFELKGGILYGPIPSRRLGFSLGVNILPLDLKVCTWDCLYCQCGWTDRSVDQTRVDPVHFPSIQTLAAAFEEGFAELAGKGRRPESITLSGNGEPTLHPRFGEAVDALIRARDRHLPGAKTSILSNGERLGEAGIRSALDRLDIRCLKLDAGDEKTSALLDRPLTPFDLGRYVENLKQLKRVTLQAFFTQGAVDNTTPGIVSAWLACLREIRPAEVHLYSLDRVPPAKGLKKTPAAVLEAIAERARDEVGVDARVFS
jgi:wyosine [tRNA(Phe)-imidazoG37] synthetase (radical SAM superfamily)